MPARRQVFIVDQQMELHQPLATALRAAGYRPRTFDSARAFIDELDRLGAGCLLLELTPTEPGGIDILEVLMKRTTLIRAVIMTTHGDVGTAVRAMKLGAFDFIERPIGDAHILQVVEGVFTRLAHDERQRRKRERARRAIDRLSPRERDVLAGLARGRPNKLLAHDLGLSARTVEMHRAHMMDRLGVSSLPDALRIAFESGRF